MQSSESSERQAFAGRLPFIDAVRGLAIVAMVIYHFSWDLSSLGFISIDVVKDPVWRNFARTVAASFLFLVGVGLILAHGRGIRWRAFFRRLMVIVAAALLVTIVTSFVFPSEYVFFGILHCIAVSSVLALPFLHAPVFVILAAAAFCFIAPHLGPFKIPSLDAPALGWLGLGVQSPETLDYVPIFPWFSFVLLGIVAARPVLPWAVRTSLPPRVWKSPMWRGLIWSGRHSLPIYLVHQPLLFGSLFLIAQMTDLPSTKARADFMNSCQASCRHSGGEQSYCVEGCACAAGKLKAEGLWLNGSVSRAEINKERISSAVRPCFERF